MLLSGDWTLPATLGDAPRASELSLCPPRAEMGTHLAQGELRGAAHPPLGAASSRPTGPCPQAAQGPSLISFLVLLLRPGPLALQKPSSFSVLICASAISCRRSSPSQTASSPTAPAHPPSPSLSGSGRSTAHPPTHRHAVTPILDRNPPPARPKLKFLQKTSKGHFPPEICSGRSLPASSAPASPCQAVSPQEPLSNHAPTAAQAGPAGRDTGGAVPSEQPNILATATSAEQLPPGTATSHDVALPAQLDPLVLADEAPSCTNPDHPPATSATSPGYDSRADFSAPGLSLPKNWHKRYLLALHWGDGNLC